MSNLPSGTVTFLFTDIEGSTRLLQTLRDEFADALAEHRALVRNAFAQWNGVEVDTQGDSFFVAFERASDAVNAVVDAQRALSAQKFPRDAVIRVRMGLHTGEPQLSGAHYVGMDVHRAARIMAAAHGGQVLLSQTTFDLIESELPEGVTVRDLGEHRLKDLRRPKHLYQLVIAQLQIDFPPIKTLDVLPNNLPIQLTSFVGREREITELAEILTNDEGRKTNEPAEIRRPSYVVRLLTLTGVGGTGKTRLALQVAADVLDEYQDGVWLIELAPLSDPALVPQTVATILGLREQTGRAFIDVLQDYLRNKHLLFVLDNCEHLIEACAELADMLLHAAPHLKILATSREALGIAGETSYPVRSLSLPDTKHPGIENFSQSDAVRLFIDRAVSAQPTFQVTNDNAPAVAQICARLDGIPLAIELAAARVKGLSVEQIASRLDDRFRLLTGGSRTALPRQRTLQAAIDWSYKLLSDEERVLLRRLSVFAGGWTVEAAEFVCHDERRRTNDESSGSEIRPPSFVLRRVDILDLLLRLVDKSLVVAETETSEPRYHMLETIRQYAQEKLEEVGEAGRIRDQHLEFFLNFAEYLEPSLQGPDELASLNRLEVENDNLRAALDWSLAQDNLDISLRLAGSLQPFWSLRGFQGEGLEWLLRALRKDGSATHTIPRVKALWGAGWLAREDDTATGRALLEKSLSISRELDYPRGIGRALQGLGFIKFDEGDMAQALSLWEESVAIFRELGEKGQLAFSLRLVGNIVDYPGARAALEESLRLFREVGTNVGTGQAFAGLGILDSYEGNYASARSYLEQALALRESVGDKFGIAFLLQLLGQVNYAEGDLGEATVLQKRSLERWRQMGYRVRSAISMVCLATVANAQDHPERAAKLLAASSMRFEFSGVSLLPGTRDEYDAGVTRAREQLDEATFAKAWAGGRTMTFDEAIEFALSDTDSR